MWEYTEKVKTHFLNPCNVGEIEDADALSPEMVIVGDRQIAAYHPLVSQRIEKIWPKLCCCLAMCRAESEDGQAELDLKESKIVEITMRKARLKQIIKQNGGNYKGTGFVFDAKQAQGLCEPAEVVLEEGEDEEMTQ